MINAPSDTYKKLYYEIIDPLFERVCYQAPNYYLKEYIGRVPIQVAIGNKFEEHQNYMLQNMERDRLDRHKLAACICGAIVELQPFTGYRGAEIVKCANETIAFYVGVATLKLFMICNYVDKIKNPAQNTDSVIGYLKKNFEVKFPDKICDTKEYANNIGRALHLSYRRCDKINDNCFSYNALAYSKIFFHLESQNQDFLKDVYDQYCAYHSRSISRGGVPPGDTP